MTACTCPGRNGYSDVCTVHGVAALYPAQPQRDGRAWYRPVRPPGSDLSQWGWTSQRKLAHPAYAALYDAQTGGLHPEGLCGGDCSGCVSEGEGGGRDGSSQLDALRGPLQTLAEAQAAVEATGLLW
ncbi:hypothetical protein I5H08_gp022 [Mycobacterium phage Yuna]|uniref:Uncharacterized protein n=1 Tax=Mycobacterium phage Yuna TaxID=2599885 RepID=A0A5J6TFP0_9CAUD|nr:hypothetical protein I5H08_gp022 [Mycobacterium phage Yuna]QFG09465.1 hypothetical protein PBI_YUNA_83 [Mycobacterium phage Yuna]